MSTTAMSKFQTLTVTTPKEYVYQVSLNRPELANAMNHTMWIEIGKCFNELEENSDCRAIVLDGAGKHFSSGIDVKDFMKVASELAQHDDVARKAKVLITLIKGFQNGFTAIEQCNKPVISAIHSACIGAGVDLITAVDIRVCTKNSYFQVKEVDMGLAADVGTLQRLPKVIGSQSLVRDLCFSGRKMNADEALSSGLVSKVFADKDSMMTDAIQLAEQIASKSPVAVQGTKKALIFSRDHSVQESLDQIARWNQFMLQSEDFATAVMASATKSDATFSKL